MRQMLLGGWVGVAVIATAVVGAAQEPSKEDQRHLDAFDNAMVQLRTARRSPANLKRRREADLREAIVTLRGHLDAVSEAGKATAAFGARRDDLAAFQRQVDEAFGGGGGGPAAPPAAAGQDEARLQAFDRGFAQLSAADPRRTREADVAGAVEQLRTLLGQVSEAGRATDGWKKRSADLDALVARFAEARRTPAAPATEAPPPPAEPTEPVAWDDHLPYFDAVWWPTAPYRLLGATDQESRWAMNWGQAIGICKRELAATKAVGPQRDLRAAQAALLEAAGSGVKAGLELRVGEPLRPLPSPLDRPAEGETLEVLKRFDAAWEAHARALAAPPGGSAAQELAAREALRSIVAALVMRDWEHAPSTLALRERFFRLHEAAARLEAAFGPTQVATDADLQRVARMKAALPTLPAPKELMDPARQAQLRQALQRARRELEGVERPHDRQVLAARADLERLEDELERGVAAAAQTAAELGDIDARLREIKARFPQEGFDAWPPRDHDAATAVAWLERMHPLLAHARADAAWLARVRAETTRGGDVAAYADWFANAVHGYSDRGIVGAVAYWRARWTDDRKRAMACKDEVVPADLLWVRHQEHVDRLRRGAVGAAALGKHAALFGGDAGDATGDAAALEAAIARIEAGHLEQVRLARLPAPGRLHAQLADTFRALVTGARALRVTDDKILRTTTVRADGSVVSVYDRVEAAYAALRGGAWHIDYAYLVRDVVGGRAGEWRFSSRSETLGVMLEEHITEP